MNRLSRIQSCGTWFHRRRLGVLLIAAMMSVVAGCDSAVFGALNLVAEKRGYAEHRDIVFDAAHQLALDVYVPAHAHDAPVVVFFYGGRWEKGSRGQYRYAGAALAAQGMVVVIPDYRKYPRVKLDGFMSDAANAVAWTRAHAVQYGGNPRDIFLMGHSAGAHIGALLATDATWLKHVGMDRADVAGFIGLAGPYDFLPITDSDMRGMFGDSAQQQRRSQPVDFVDGGEPPMLLLQGTGDHTVAPKNTTSLAAAIRQHGGSVDVRMYPGVGHSGILLSLSRPFRGHDTALADSVRFIRAHPSAH